MALIECPDCGRKVSERAVQCPQCAAPIAAAGAPDNGVVTTQATAKPLKAHLAVSLALMGIGLLATLTTCSTMRPDGSDAGLVISAIILVVGIVWFVVTDVLILWSHE